MSFTLLRAFRRDKKTFDRYLERLEYERTTVDAAIVAITTLFREMMDDVCLSGDNPQLLMTRVNKFLFPDDVSESFVNLLIPVADIHCNGIITYLTDNCPALTKDDLTLCALICLGLPSHSLQKIFNQSNPASLYNMRSRIRHRIGIPEGESTLEKYLQALTLKLEEKRISDKKRPY